MNKQHSVAILLGAGFSVPAGYPVGNCLNEKLERLTSLKDSPIAFSLEGKLCVKTDTLDKECNQWEKSFSLCKNLIKEYKKEVGNFDYENFYDFLEKEVVMQKYQNCGKGLIDDIFDYKSLLINIKPLFNQIVAYLISPESNGCWDGVDGYNGFLQCVARWCDSSTVNVHTLNHDTLFESFSNTPYLNEKIADGFDEFGSDFFGELHCGNKTYKVRLERYTGRYNKPVRLYKLHGSLDYVIFRKRLPNMILVPQKYVKIPIGIASGDILYSCGRKMKYESSPFELHTDFLTGTTSKMLRYNEPLLYKKLFKKFRQNLRNADKLIIIGYGCHDEGINNLILENYDYEHKPTFIVDYNPSKTIRAFAKKLHTVPIKKSVTDIDNKTFELT